MYRSNPRQLAFDDAIYDWLFLKLSPHGSWLDAGCGSGEHAIRLAKRVDRLSAIDLSADILEVAKQAAVRAGVQNRVEFSQGSLEDLSPALSAENVHCRGVMMHIPDWHTVLLNLCRNVKPGGHLVLFEGNQSSLEVLFVRLVRKFIKTKSRMDFTEGGIEFWSEVNGEPFLFRAANLAKVEEVLRAQGIVPLFRQSTFVIDLNRLPAALQGIGITLNQIWFHLNLPMASGVLLVGRRNP